MKELKRLGNYFYFSEVLELAKNDKKAGYRRYASLPESVKKEVVPEGKVRPVKLLNEVGVQLYLAKWGPMEQAEWFANESRSMRDLLIAQKTKENETLMIESKEAKREAANAQDIAATIEVVAEEEVEKAEREVDLMKAILQQRQEERIAAMQALKSVHEGVSIAEAFEEVRKVYFA